MEDDIKEIQFREETPKVKIKPKTRQMMLLKAEPVLSNADFENFEKFQDVFNTSTEMEFVEKASNHELNKTIESLHKSVTYTWGYTM